MSGESLVGRLKIVVPDLHSGEIGLLRALEMIMQPGFRHRYPRHLSNAQVNTASAVEAVECDTQGYVFVYGCGADGGEGNVDRLRLRKFESRSRPS